MTTFVNMKIDTDAFYNINKLNDTYNVRNGSCFRYLIMMRLNYIINLHNNDSTF